MSPLSTIVRYLLRQGRSEQQLRDELEAALREHRRAAQTSTALHMRRARAGRVRW